MGNKVAIVTGAAGGIGQATALHLARGGVDLVLGDLADCSETAQMVGEAGGKAASIRTDVTSSDSWNEAVDCAVKTYGRLDALANIAGAPNRKSIQTVVDMSEETWNLAIDVDLKGVWLGMKAVIPVLVENGGGRIVNVSSIAASRGLPGLAAYSAAKAGLEGLSRQAAVEYGPHNVAVNVVAPGAIESRANPDPAGFEKAAGPFSVFNRIGRPNEVASVIAYLLQDASFVTGQLIRIDGGWTVSAGSPGGRPDVPASE